ncbi:uncharacterized protein GGS22DRAFT_153712 [Annulohypoxylon maeteangense]|uniref:uncharacterized protein n=1 Tax=Annulohypoxylon maeteangense TaxID=1927788 RepID=UPI002008B7ED|nr:uncharacterized protein GGS22DRAFT_153712 [Annulohypoxylon maeteangense]KAI0889358.1 hypothetical protein GGS22DRAFT_153712 [Annulohypoxylon maeteangense]
MVLKKKEVYTVVTPIPTFIPRQLAIDILHSHGEVITLNPLVLEYKQIKAPRDAASDEYFSTWYEINERIQYIPGMGRLGSGKITFNGCFHDLPWGLQTHIYAPMGVDLRNKYRIGGNQPGIEAPEPQEMGLAALGAPADGLYLREDIEIKCNITIVNMVKAQMKTASKEMVQRIIKKAELLDAGILQAMIEDGKMKTYNPNDRTYTGGLNAGMKSPPMSPATPFHPPMSPSTPYQVPRPISVQQGSRPGTASSLSYPAHWQAQFQQLNGGYDQTKMHQQYAELPASQSAVPTNPSQGMIMELPGDFHHPQSSPHLQPPHPSPTYPHQGRNSPASLQSHSPEPHKSWSWSQSQPSPSLVGSRPTSYSSDASSAGFASPGLDHKGFAAELPTHQETTEEYHQQNQGGGRGGAYRSDSHAGRGYAYNPADYAQVRRG